MDSIGIVQYAPWIEQAEVYDAQVDGIDLKYIHQPQTADKEEKRSADLQAKHCAGCTAAVRRLERSGCQSDELCD